jgi:hypothetical protein
MTKFLGVLFGLISIFSTILGGVYIHYERGIIETLLFLILGVLWYRVAQEEFKQNKEEDLK